MIAPVINIDRCKGCKLCVVVCPKNILSMSDNINKKGVRHAICIDEQGCSKCGNCYVICPDTSIEVKKI